MSNKVTFSWKKDEFGRPIYRETRYDESGSIIFIHECDTAEMVELADKAEQILLDEYMVSQHEKMRHAC